MPVLCYGNSTWVKERSLEEEGKAKKTNQTKTTKPQKLDLSTAPCLLEEDTVFAKKVIVWYSGSS